MLYNHKTEINNFRNVIFAYCIIMITYLCIQFIMVYKQNIQQTEEIKQIQLRQFELEKSVEIVKTDRQVLDSISANLYQISEQVQDIKETTYDIKALEFQTEMNALDKIEDKEKWFLEYKDICERYADYVPQPISIYDVYTTDEINLLLYMGQTEIGSGSFDAIVNVFDVVWNRQADSKWPNQIKKIVVPGQFAFNNTRVTERVRLALEYSFMFPDQTGGALAFHSMGQTEKFGSYYYLFSDSSGHHFYGEKGNEK